MANKAAAYVCRGLPLHQPSILKERDSGSAACSTTWQLERLPQLHVGDVKFAQGHYL